MEDLGQRVHSLEREIGRLRRREKVVAMALLGLLLMGAGQGVSKEVRTGKVVLVDAKGHECGQLAAGPHGGVLDLNLLHGKDNPVGFHAEAGELRIREIHNDDMLYVGMLGTRCYGQLSVEPPASAGLSPTQSSAIALRALGSAPELSLRGPGGQWDLHIGPRGPQIEERKTKP